jgi:hypothetical protein
LKIGKGVIIFSIGAMLCLTSVYPLFLLLREIVVAKYIEDRYDVNRLFNNLNSSVEPTYVFSTPFYVNGNVIEIITTDTKINAPKTRFDKQPNHIMKLQIKINGKNESFPTEAYLPPDDKEDSRFWSWLNIVLVRGKGEEKVAIIQRITGNWVIGENIDSHTKSQKWRILWIDEHKQVKEEIFSYPDRAKHLLGVRLVQVSAQSSSFIGYMSDIGTTLPNLYFPLVYPYLTALIGFVLCGISFRELRRNKYGHLKN